VHQTPNGRPSGAGRPPEQAGRLPAGGKPLTLASPHQQPPAVVLPPLPPTCCCRQPCAAVRLLPPPTCRRHQPVAAAHVPLSPTCRRHQSAVATRLSPPPTRRRPPACRRAAPVAGARVPQRLVCHRRSRSVAVDLPPPTFCRRVLPTPPAACRWRRPAAAPPPAALPPRLPRALLVVVPHCRLRLPAATTHLALPGARRRGSPVGADHLPSPPPSHCHRFFGAARSILSAVRPCRASTWDIHSPA